MVDEVTETPDQTDVIDETADATPVENTSTVDEDKQAVTPNEPEAGEPEPPKKKKEPSNTFKNRIQRKNAKIEVRDATIAELQERNRALEARLDKPTPVPNVDDFQTEEEYSNARADHRADKRFDQRERESINAQISNAEQARNQAAGEAFDARSVDMRKAHPDFDAVLNSLQASPAMIETARESEYGPEIAFHWASNPAEGVRIAAMAPMQVAIEVGRLESQFAHAPPPKKETTNAPATHTPIGGTGGSVPVALEKLTNNPDKWRAQRYRDIAAKRGG